MGYRDRSQPDPHTTPLLSRAWSSRCLYIGPYRIDVDANQLINGQSCFQLQPKTMQVLVYLIRHAGQVVSRDELIENVWQANSLSDDVVTHAVYELRKVLNDDARLPRFIQTIPKGGYRLIADVGMRSCDGHQAVLSLLKLALFLLLGLACLWLLLSRLPEGRFPFAMAFPQAASPLAAEGKGRLRSVLWPCPHPK